MRKAYCIRQTISSWSENFWSTLPSAPELPSPKRYGLKMSRTVSALTGSTSSFFLIFAPHFAPRFSGLQSACNRVEAMPVPESLAGVFFH
jgi:hypothetical protein